MDKSEERYSDTFEKFSETFKTRKQDNKSEESDPRTRVNLNKRIDKPEELKEKPESD